MDNRNGAYYEHWKRPLQRCRKPALDETRNRKPAHASGGRIPVKVAGTVKEFEVDSSDPEDWVYPSQYHVARATLRSFSPHVLYAWCALKQAIKDANLSEEEIQDPDSGLYTSSGGSMRSIHKHFEKMDRRGVMACNPLAIVASIAGTLTFNLVAALGVGIFHGLSFCLCVIRACSGHCT